MVTLLSIPLGWVGWEIDQRRREKVVIVWIEEMGGQVSFHSEKTIGNLFRKRVSFVSLVSTPVSDLSPLVELKNLEGLDLSYTQLNDLSPLAELKNLDYLDLGGTKVNNLSLLASLGRFFGTKVSKEQVEELRLALPNCTIHLTD